MNWKPVKTYLIWSGVAFNLALVFSVCVFAKVVYQAGSIPSALAGAASKLDAPVLEPIADSLSYVSESLTTPDNAMTGFDSSHWPSVGPDYTHKTVKKSRSIDNVYVSTAKEIMKAINEAKPGQNIYIEDGEYAIKTKRIKVNIKESPTAQFPVTLTAINPGKVTLKLNAVEGIFINQPYWRISGIRFVGNCASDTRCAHAIHVVGNGSHTEITDNEFVDFNAAIKVNGLKGSYPDKGLIKRNHFYASKPRNTNRSITPINIDHAHHWQVSNNIIRDFIKGKGNLVSYGAFMKGGVHGGIFENNLVVCNTSGNHYPGSQVGLSIGGGGMKARRNNEPFESLGTIIRSNVIVNCSDVGIYVNRGKDALINNNTIYNTTGIDVRFPISSAAIINNIYSGQLRERDGGVVENESGNYRASKGLLSGSGALSEVLKSPESGNFAIKESKSSLNQDADIFPFSDYPNARDFCGQNIEEQTKYVGALMNGTCTR